MGDTHFIHKNEAPSHKNEGLFLHYYRDIRETFAFCALPPPGSARTVTLWPRSRPEFGGTGAEFVTRIRMLYRGGLALFLLCLALAGCQTGVKQNTTDAAAGSPAEQATLAAFRQEPSAVGGKTHVVAFVRPGRDMTPYGVSHLAVPVSLNGGPPRAFVLDTGAPVTTILISKRLFDSALVAQKLNGAQPVRVRGISGATATAYRVTAKSIAVGDLSVVPFTYVLLSSERDLADLGDTPYGPVVGILGNDFLSRYRVTVDYRNHVVSLEER